MAIPRNLSILAQGANTTGVLGASKGGTNLTAFVANGAVYATSTTQLAVGTLPVLSGGTGATTLTANNVIIGNGTGAVQFVAPGTSGNILTSNGTNWLSSPAPATGVTTLSFGTTGLTPNSATNGAITVAGTLNVSNGGTGSTTLTANNVVIGNGTSGVQFVAPGTSGNVLTSNGTNWISSPASGVGVTTISFGSTGLTPNTATNGAVTVAGTLNVSNGGTGRTTLTQYGILYGNATAAVNITSAGTLNYGLIGQGSAAPIFDVVNPTGGDTAGRAFNVNDLTVSANYTIPTGMSAMSTGPITVNSGVTVTIPSGSKWVVL